MQHKRRKTSPAHFAPEFMAGDEIIFNYAGLLTGRVSRVKFRGRKVVYVLSVAMECEVPASEVVGRESDVLGTLDCGEGGSAR